MSRRDKNIAKTEIYETFRQCVESGKAKISVSALIALTNVSRMTFYNHFADQNALVAWGFRFDMAQVLQSYFEHDQLLVPNVDPYEFDLPFYSRTPSNALSLDQTRYFRAFYDMLYKNQDYYRALLRTSFAPPLRRYLVEVYAGLFYGDVEYFLNGRKMPEEAKHLISDFYAEGVVHNMLDSFMTNGPKKADTIPSFGPIDNLVHESLLHIVEAYQSEKSNLYFRSRRLS